MGGAAGRIPASSKPVTLEEAAARIPASSKPVTLDEGAALLKAQGGTLTAQVTVTRAGTGKVETYTLAMGDQPKEA